MSYLTIHNLKINQWRARRAPISLNISKVNYVASLMRRVWYGAELFEHATVFFILFIDEQVSYLTIYNLRINQWRARRARHQFKSQYIKS